MSSANGRLSSDDESESDCEDEQDEPGWCRFDRVLREERECIDGLRSQRSADGTGGVPFSLAFSGGGIRAAAFQAGVLWRLAQMNRLKDVEYFAAVSGGGYITSAFATHCLATEPPAEGGVKDWYLGVVSRTILRMQENAGDFVRDCFKDPCGPDDNSGCLPRSFDLPILIGTLLVTLNVQPLVFFIAFLAPLTAVIEIHYGAAMRAAFCAPPGEDLDWLNGLKHFWAWSQLGHLCNFVAFMIILAVLVMVLRMMPCCKLGRRTGKRRPQASAGYLLGYGFSAFLVRTVAAMVTFIVCLYAAMLAQELSFFHRVQTKYDRCNNYISLQSEKSKCSNFHPVGISGGARAADFKFPWYEDPLFANYTDTLLELGLLTVDNGTIVSIGDEYDKHMLINEYYFVHIAVIAFSVCSIVTMPLIGAVLIKSLLYTVGPLYLAIISVGFIQAMVFGAITQKQFAYLVLDYDTWTSIMTGCLVLALLVTPFYEELRTTLHRYYKRTLRRSFFEGGHDRPFAGLAKCAYCPFIILTGTSNDYQPPGDNDTIAEISFSALHCGGEETGYFEMPPWRTLGKCTAITGAGCLDAISLSMNDALTMRFWLELLNLSWGDFIIFENLRFSGLYRWLAPYAGDLQATIVRAIHRFFGGFPIFVVYLGILCGWHAYRSSNGEGHSCDRPLRFLWMSSRLLLIVVALSFFTFFPWASCFSLSPFVRQFHQVTKYFYVGNRPPMMLYMTDGGVKDCTTLSQLLWRRCERILLVLAAADPHDDLGVLKTAMQNALDLKLASFYDPNDPRNEISLALEQFKLDKSAPFLHLGIRYCFDGEAAELGPKTGHLFIVKNRLPPTMKGQPVQRPLTEDMIRGFEDADRTYASRDSDDSAEEEEWNDLTTDQLGPFGCCDCCHTRGMNCGPKFPHGTFTGYLYLSPQWCNSLMRLGHAVSVDAIQAVTFAGPLSAPWETTVGQPL